MALKDTLRAFNYLKTRNKSEWSNVFFDMKKLAYFESLSSTLYIGDKTQMFKKFPSKKINVTKNAFFYFTSSNSSQFYLQSAVLIRAEAHGSSLKLCVGFSIFDSVLLLFHKKRRLDNFKMS